MRKSLLAVAVCAALSVSVILAGESANKKSTVTVGEFAMKISSALGKSAADPKKAVASLKTLGVKVDADASASLTEGEAARMLADLGVRVNTQNPGKGLSAAKADQLAIATGFASSASATPAATLPTHCLALRNRGNCQECCKVENGCIDQEALCEFASTCSKFCKAVLPPGQASPSEPGD